MWVGSFRDPWWRTESYSCSIVCSNGRIKTMIRTTLWLRNKPCPMFNKYLEVPWKPHLESISEGEKETDRRWELEIKQMSQEEWTQKVAGVVVVFSTAAEVNWRVEKRNWVGRNSDCKWFLKSRSRSESHAAWEENEGGWEVLTCLAKQGHKVVGT